MKWSMFIIKVEKDREILLYNTFNEAIVELELETYNNITENLDHLEDSEVVDNLKTMEFLLPRETNEKELFLNSLKKEWEADKHMAVHILPTTACNFNCPYCYQSGIEKQHFLTDDKIEQTLDYLSNYIVVHSINEATIILHGGEPTMYFGAAYNIVPKLDELFKDNNISYKLQIVSNGYNLTPEKADFLAKYNWKRFQVTLDGPEEFHNQRRNLKNGKVNSFKKICSNIQYIIDNNYLEKVSLRINYDKQNIASIPNFFEEIKEKFGAENISLSFGFISKTISDTDAQSYITKYGLLESEIKDPYINLHHKARELGFELDNLFMFDGMCTAKLDKGMVISSDGNIYKCLSGVGRQEFVENNIYNEEYNNPNYLFPELYEECFNKKCEYIPLCNTGCRFNAFLENGKIHSISCKREILEDMNNELLKDIYLT